MTKTLLLCYSSENVEKNHPFFAQKRVQMFLPGVRSVVFLHGQ